MSTHENASISLLEGLASGCAVVTTNTSGCPETVGNAGVCLEAGNVVALTSTLKRIIVEESYRNTLMQAARKRAVDNYDWPVIAQKYLDTFQSATGK